MPHLQVFKSQERVGEGVSRGVKEIWRKSKTEKEIQKYRESKRRRKEIQKNCAGREYIKKKVISCNKEKKNCEVLCCAQAMEVMPGWGLCSFHHKAPSGVQARPRLSRPLAL